MTEAAPGGATRRLDVTLTTAVVVARGFAVTQVVGIAREVSRRVRHRTVLGAGVAGIVAHAGWASARSLRRRSVRDPVLAWSDAAAQVLALVVEAASWGSRDLPPDPRWSETFGVVVASWLPFESAGRPIHRVSLATWLAAYGATTRDRSASLRVGQVRGQRINEALGQVTYSAVCGALARAMVDQAAALDEARGQAVEQAERIATEQERHRQHRAVHDASLQVLEAVAGGWELDDEDLFRRIDFETARLRRVLEGAPEAEHTDLRAALHELAQQFAMLGLHVELDGDGDGVRLSAAPRLVEALRDATHEALMNVHKHAGTGRAFVRTAARDDALEVTVTDHGAGFDTAAPRTGFGVAQSIEARLAEAGGRAQVQSTRGAGTEVRLWIPR
jgi:signal transduction histidine kinase